MSISSSKMENSFKKQPLSSNAMIELINLKYGEFIEMLKELNSIAEYFLDENGFSLSFSISKGTDQTFLWKFTVRIECTKLKVGTTDIQSYRILRLSQFINIYNYVKQHTEALKVFQPEFQNQNANNKSSLSFSQIDKLGGGGGGACSSTKSSVNNKMTDSKIYDAIQSMSPSNAPTKKEDEICCICMEATPNLILTCAHSFCENCLKEWKITSNTCPICRSISEESDCFVLTDKPDYYHIQDEISKSLFQITEQNDSNKNKVNDRSNSDLDEDFND